MNKDQRVRRTVRKWTHVSSLPTLKGNKLLPQVLHEILDMMYITVNALSSHRDNNLERLFTTHDKNPRE